MIARDSRPAERGFLAGLRADQRGNTVAIVAAAIIPLCAMVGSGVDMSRNYLVKSRLQQACDAGALGGRRSMGANDWSTSSNTVARNYFRTNFVEGSYGTTGLTYSFSEDQGTVSGTASVQVPTSLMRIFGYTAMPVSVTCSGKMKIPNSDVMFVLDTTGSMAQTNAGDTSSKMEGLKAAVRNFYATLEAARGADTRIRYGFVPFSANVNVGFLLQRDWVVDSATYQSREARFAGNYNSSQVSSGWSPVGGTYTDSTSTRQASCPADTYSYSDSTNSTSSTDSDGVITTATTTRRVWTGNNYTCTATGSNYTVAKRAYNNYTEQMVVTTTQTPRYTWLYQPRTYNVAGLKGDNSDGSMEGGTITAAIGNLNSNAQPTARTVSWNGCIEERQTVRATNFSTIPSGAIDLDIDRIPSNDASRWRPSLPGLVYGRALSPTRSGSWSTAAVTTSSNYYNVEDGGTAYCPAQARKLAEITSAGDLDQYLATLVAVGSTYHDIGMLWGARLISPTGLFANENASPPPNGGTVARHIIYMTDGITDSSQYAYTSYGLEPLDRRRVDSANETDIDNNIVARFSGLCSAVKNKNITVWVVSFGTAMTPMLSNCASPGKAYSASNSAALNQAFSSIATEIAQLRLTQ